MSGGCTVGFDALGGNMPFLGGRRIATDHGPEYAAWLTQVHGGTGGTDYVGYFFLRAAELVPKRGAVGFIATSSIAEGDNRRTTLVPLVSAGFELYDVQDRMPWPGNVAVLIAVLHLARGSVAQAIPLRVLDGRPVATINSRLRSGHEYPEPQRLAGNAGLALVGCFLRGDGFVLADKQARELLNKHPDEREVVRPFLTGEDLNSRPDQSPSRYVIAFFDRSLEEAARFAAAFQIVEECVRPQRQRLKSTGADADHKKYWWRFANTRKELREALKAKTRVLAIARVSKHVIVAFVSPETVPSEQVVIFPLTGFSHFAVLQSRVHEAWVRLHATTMGDGVRYSASECFDTFPFPRQDPRATFPELEAVGEALYTARTKYMLDHKVGLTETYNRLLNANWSDDQIARLRALHVELDRAVIAAYEWQDVAVPAFCGAATAHQAVDAFQDAVVERLYALNAERSGSIRPERARPGVAKPRRARPSLAKANDEGTATRQVRRTLRK